MRLKIFSFFLLLVLSAVPILTNAEILVNIGVLDLNSLSELYPEAKELKNQWNKIKAKNHFWLSIYEEQSKAASELIRQPQRLSLSERINLNTRKQLLDKFLSLLEQKSEADLKKLQLKQSIEIKKKIFLALKTARRKKGFGIVLSGKQKMILFYDESLDLNPAVIEELVPVKTK